MKTFHRTSTEAAISILSCGFVGDVWLSRVPLPVDMASKGDVVLKVNIPRSMFAGYERVGHDDHYRCCVIPAEVLNTCAAVTVYSHDFDACTLVDLCRRVDGLREAGKLEEAERLKVVVIPFLLWNRIVVA